MGRLLLIMWPKSPWIKGENRIPFKPERVLGLTPNKYKSKWKKVSLKKTIQHTIKNSKGYFTTENNSKSGNFLIISFSPKTYQPINTDNNQFFTVSLSENKKSQS